MKKIFVIVLLMLSSLSINAQEHLKFKGIPIDGSLNSFVSKLKLQDYSLTAEQDGMAILNGTFAGYTQCQIVVVSTNDIVWKVVVLLPKDEKWNDAKKKYSIFKETFKEKYNVIPTSEEHIDSYGGEGSGMEHYAFQEDKAKWASSYSLPSGVAEVSIKYAFYNSLQVWIEYYDSTNTQKRNKTIIDDI